MTRPPIRPPSLSRYPSYLAAQLTKAAQRLLLDRLADHGLRLHHFAVLAAVADFGPRCQQDLCDALDIDKSHMVTFVDDLHEGGLVTKRRDPADRRRHQLGITAEGRRVLAHLHEAERACQEQLFGHLDPDQRAAFRTALSSVVDRLDRARLDSESAAAVGVSA